MRCNHKMMETGGTRRNNNQRKTYAKFWNMMLAMLSVNERSAVQSSMAETYVRSSRLVSQKGKVYRENIPRFFLEPSRNFHTVFFWSVLFCGFPRLVTFRRTSSR